MITLEKVQSPASAIQFRRDCTCVALVAVAGVCRPVAVLLDIVGLI